jgi:exodeoxyribonuclease V alpha subunit
MYLKLAETNPLEDIIVVTSQNKGAQGAIAINNQIQNAVNPKRSENALQLVREDYTVEYRENDMVMQTVNDYHSIICDENGYYETDDDGEPIYETLIANGETGRIVRVNNQNLVVRFDNHYILRHKADLDKMSLAYAITAHKSQGSGYKNVIVVTPSTHTYMLNSNLLYVAYTRAKERCFNIGNPKTIALAVKKKQNLSRETFLQDLIKKTRSVGNESNVNENN